MEHELFRHKKTDFQSLFQYYHEEYAPKHRNKLYYEDGYRLAYCDHRATDEEIKSLENFLTDHVAVVQHCYDLFPDEFYYRDELAIAIRDCVIYGIGLYGNGEWEMVNFVWKLPTDEALRRINLISRMHALFKKWNDDWFSKTYGPQMSRYETRLRQIIKPDLE
jgi:hypothetical protein